MNKSVFILAVLAMIFVSSESMAQRPGRGDRDGGRRGGGERGQRGERPRPISPLMMALDIDKDGKLSKEEIEGAAKALKAMDKNSDGMLDEAELTPQRQGRQGGGPGGQRGGGQRGGDPNSFVDRIMERDSDGDGKVSKEEAGENMARGFDRMDADKDGYISRKELEDMMKQWSNGGSGGYRGGGRGVAEPPKSKDNRPAFDDN